MTMPIPLSLRGALACVLPLALMACASQPTEPEPGAPQATMRTVPMKGTKSISPALADAAERAMQPGLPTAEDKARMFKGTGVLVKGQLPGGGLPAATAVQATGNSIVLNFEGADLREVVRSILGDTLGEAYTID